MNILSSYLRKLDGCFFLKYGFKSGCPETRYGIQDSYFESQIEAVVWRWSIEKVFLEILQHSQENTCARVSFLINGRMGFEDGREGDNPPSRIAKLFQYFSYIKS